jgi:amino acid adenylation domain-containing protein
MQAATFVEGFRLSPQQRSLWKLQEDPSCHARSFESLLVLLLEGELRADALRKALEKVCVRHESLRTTFRRVPGVSWPLQSVEGVLSPSWRTIDLSDVTGTAQDDEVGALLALERRRTFDYENGPLVHATLLVLSSERHLLSICMPALYGDRRTLANLGRDLCGCYGGIINGSEVEVEPLQYTQFSEWQNSLWEDDEEASRGKEYWSRQDLSSAAVVLPGQRVRSSARSEIATESRSVSATNANVLLAAWLVVLWRLSGRSVVVGNVSEGRSYELLHDAFGLFERTLPVCSELTDGLRFEEVVEQIERFQRESEEWQDYFARDLTAAGPLNHFVFGFEFADLPDACEIAGLRVSVWDWHCNSDRFDLKLTCVGKGAELDAAKASEVVLRFEYDTEAFDEAYVRHLAEKLQTLLDAALANPETKIDQLPIVSDRERQQLLFDWNDTKRNYPVLKSLPLMFEQQVEQRPDALAAVFQNQQLTFAELNRRANQVAHWLRKQGAGPETAVGICFEPSLEMLIAVLGVLKAGGAYVPLDPHNPRQRIDEVLSNAGASILLTDLSKTVGEPTGNPQTQTAAENLAYIIYTSGSTGQPKGVMVQHRSVLNLAAALHEEVYASLGPSLKVGLSAPLAFDASVKQLVQLLHGHTLHLLPEELRLDAVGALQYLDQHELDVLDCTPSQLKLLLAAGFSEHTTPRLMLVGGEALDESTWSRLAADPRTRFFNVYGPTECTVDAAWTPVAGTHPTIGRPIPNAETYILDKNLKPAGVHLAGELHIGGTGLARGYLDAPDKTAERFIPDGLSGNVGARLYRTGDLARQFPDGTISFIGRNDSQVKVRGHRIELGEIETALREHDKVRHAVVIARESNKLRDNYSNDVRLVGYVTAESGKKIDVAELRRMLSERLPDYMLPSFLVVIDELPLTRNGKVDLNALPAPETIRARDENYVAPRNEIEATITRIWQEALGVERIGVNDNFFDAGGHSLLMVQVHNKLIELFEKKISIVEMFAKPTISSLAEYFSETNGHQPTFDKVMDRAARRRQAATTRQ